MGEGRRTVVLDGAGRATACRALVVAAAWLLCLALIWPALAGAEAEPRPSADELLRDYPLHPEPEGSGGTVTRRSPEAAASDRRAASDRAAGGDGIGALAVVLVVLPVLGAAILVLRRRWAEAPGPPAHVRDPGAVPPALECAWSAEIRWQLAPEPSFFVWARSDDRPEPVTVERSPALEWPPDSNAAVRALGDAVRRLEAALVAAGWEPAPPGSAWYAKRFTWTPRADPRTNGAHGSAGRTPSGRVPMTRTEEGAT